MPVRFQKTSHTRLTLTSIALGMVAALLSGSPAAMGQSGHDGVPESRNFQPQVRGTDAYIPDDPRYGLLTPIPEDGNIPPIVRLANQMTEAERAYRAKLHDFRQQIRIIKREHFGPMRVQDIREQGIAKIEQFTDPAAFHVLIEELNDEQDDVLLGVLDHFQRQGEAGQAALAHIAVSHDDSAIRNEATQRLDTPPAAPVLFLLERALRSENDHIVNRAAHLANRLDVVEMIPLLIMHQTHRQPMRYEQRDRPFIFIGRQRAYVHTLVPTVGGGSAFAPVISTVTTGVALRVDDSHVIVYRTVAHDALCAIAARHVDRSAGSLDEFGYNRTAWVQWYNRQFVPAMNRTRQADGSTGGDGPATDEPSGNAPGQ